MPVVLKIKCQSDVHRMIVEDAQLSFESVLSSIKGLHQANDIIVKYLDEEEDMCTLTPATFSDFLSQATENNGKKLIKVEVFTAANNANSPPPGAGANESMTAEAEGADHQQRNPLANLVSMAVKGVKGLGKGAFGAWGCRPYQDNQLKVKMLKFGLVQLYKNELLDADCFSALLVSLLPQLVTAIAENPRKIDRKFGRLMGVPSLCDSLCAILASTQGLSHSEGLIVAWRDGQISASEALLQLLPALMAVPFDDQMAFAKALYESEEAKITAKIQAYLENHRWMPAVPLIHEGVTCDGCGASPITGVCFRCTSHPDYDLCSTCFGKKSSTHSGTESVHDFKAMIFPAPSTMMMAWKAKGKGKGKCKGKGKDKGEAASKVGQSAQQESRPCAREGCMFAATWHPTHCCGACQLGNGHGKFCQKRTFQSADSPKVSAMPADKPNADFISSVVVDDGRDLTISWNQGDDAKKVAQKFAEEHGILEDELPTIRAFVETVTLSREGTTCTDESIPTVNAHEQDVHEIQKQKDMDVLEHQGTELEAAGPAGNNAPFGEELAKQDKEENPNAKEVDNYEFVDVSNDLGPEEKSTESEGCAEANDDLLKTAMHLSGAGLGEVDVLVGLLKVHNGSVRGVLEELVNQP